MKKILSVLLCVAAVISVMAIVATQAQATSAAAIPQAEKPSQTTGTTAPTTGDKPWYENLDEWWQSFYPIFDTVWKGGLLWVSRILTWGFQLILSLAGLGLWPGGIPGIF